jgi:nicotinamide-nucleotide amidase
MNRVDATSLSRLGAEVAELAIRSGLTICTAESCTGGLVAYILTGTAGVSTVLKGGIVAYSNQAKTELLGVEPALLESAGAVSEPVAEAMARGARASLHADVAVSTTGIAGPGGGSKEKPVGLVYVAVQGPNVATFMRFLFDGDRADTMRSAAYEALKLLGWVLSSQVG